MRFTTFLRLRVRWSVGVHTPGHWGEPPGVVSEAPTRALERACVRQATGESLREWFPRCLQGAQGRSPNANSGRV